MNTKNNQRTQNTRCTIEAALLNLLKTKNIKKITVQELCRITGYNRTTFYAHYHDVYDLLDTVVLKKRKDIQAIFYDAESTSTWGLPNNCFEHFFAYISENREFFSIYLTHCNRSSILDFPLFVSYENQLQPLMRMSGIKSREEVEFRLEYMRGGLNALVCHWINTGCEISPEQLAVYFYKEYTFYAEFNAKRKNPEVS